MATKVATKKKQGVEVLAKPRTTTVEADILREAIRFFEEDTDHFTPDMYLANTESSEVHPGREVVQCCAIGGIEQAMWRITGKTVSHARNRLAYTPSEEATKGENEEEIIYSRVMGRLNRIAKDTFGDDGIVNIEQVTCLMEDEDEDRENMLAVMRAALRQTENS